MAAKAAKPKRTMVRGMPTPRRSLARREGLDPFVRSSSRITVPDVVAPGTPEMNVRERPLVLQCGAELRGRARRRCR